MISTLDDLKINESGIVVKVDGEEGIRRRLLDIGLIDGLTVQRVLTSPMGEISAYWIKGALIAIRYEDAKNILVEVV